MLCTRLLRTPCTAVAHLGARALSSMSSPAAPVLVFGHKVPDTDTVCSAMARAWDLNEQGTHAQAYRLGELNKETAYVLKAVGLDAPPVLQEALTETSVVAIVDTNNPKELPENVQSATIHSIIDHHKMAGLTTAEPLEIDMRPICSAGSILFARMKASNMTPTKPVAGLLLSCILSDSLEFRSPTTTDIDRVYAKELSALSGLDIASHAAAMFKAKADISDLSAAEVVLSDSKVFDVNGRKLRVSVHETTSAAEALTRAADFKVAMEGIKADEGVDEVLFFVVDIINEEATFVGATDAAGKIVADAFGEPVDADNMAVLPGVLSRKKQIMPKLERAN